MNPDNTRDADQETSLISAPQHVLDGLGEPFDAKPGTRYHAGLDLGLLVLRVAVGGTILLHGLQKFGLFDGPGLGALPGMLEQMGFTGPTTVLAWALALTEVGAGAALIVGLFTPLAAAGVLGVMACATWLERAGGYFPEVTADGAALGGYYFPVLVGAGALALLFTGAGRIALDLPTPWRRKPLGFGVLGLLLAAVVSVGVLFFFT